MKLWIQATSLTVSLLIFSGCSIPKPIALESAVIDKNLPTIVLTKNGLIAGMKSIAFEWQAITDPNVEGVYIYKISPKEKGSTRLKYYTTIKNRFATHYLDNNVMPDTKYSYAFSTYSKGAESILSQTIVVKTLPTLESVSWVHSITGMPKTAKILWRPHSSERVHAYVIERKTLVTEKWKKLATVYGRLNAEYIDTGLLDDYVYFYRVRALTFDNIISTPSKTLKVVTKPLPASVENIQATRNLPNKIVIKWSASKQKDFAYYALYRASKIDNHYKLIAKLHNNHFEDKIKENGKVYFYRVSVVDKDGLESLHANNSIQGMSLDAPSAPGIIDARFTGNSIKLHWIKTDPRSVKYIVKRRHKIGWFKEETTEYNLHNRTTFIDKNVEHDSTYIYSIFALDKNSIISAESVEVKIVTPELSKIGDKKSVVSNNSRNKKRSVPKVEGSKEVILSNDNLDLSGL